jgi:hypothetical protein
MIPSVKVCVLSLLKIGAIATVSLAILISIGALLNLFAYRSKLVSPIRVIPSAQRIGYEYLQAVTQKYHNYITEDKTCVRAQLRQDIDRYGGAEVQNIVVSVKWDSGNSDAQMEITSIEFDYRFAANSFWKSGEIRLLTATNLERSESLIDALPFRRIHCAGPGV